MKILRITLENIASLAGTHTVDFTCEPLRSAGLFTISGPTGSGKSTLLDGLCLALYDRTPRLAAVGRLAELNGGESQSDTRNLLRRGTGSGKVEVAFVGIDGLEWTARWEVRRSRGQSRGALQKAQTTLFQGNITSTGKGPIECGGQKKLVLEAIKEKIGLTFQQFTRAVLLAQNDFATFLKADDKERAEILQALTGTEQYEAISKAVYERCQQESQAVDNARLLLHAETPLSDESRADAESAHNQAASGAACLEAKLKKRKSESDWFSTLANLESQLQEAELQYQQATSIDAAASSRRLELRRTEIAIRQASPLRSAQQQIGERLRQAEMAREQTKEALVESNARLIEARRIHDDARAKFETNQEAATTAREQLTAARDLDSKLIPVEEQVAHAKGAAAEAECEHEAANGRLNSMQEKQASIKEEIGLLEQGSVQHQVYEPFVHDSALWLERISRAIVNERESAVLQQKLLDLLGNLDEVGANTKLSCQVMQRRRVDCTEAQLALAAAQTTQKAFDQEQFDSERSMLVESQTVLMRLVGEIKEFGKLQKLKADCDIECATLAETFSLDESRRVCILTSELPCANAALASGQHQLQFIKDTLDDHAVRFRQDLRDSTACPVCGSVEHPYAARPPELEALALKAAQEHVAEKQRQRDALKSESDRLQASCEERAKQLKMQGENLESVKTQIRDFRFASTECPLVATVLSLPIAEQLHTIELNLKDIGAQAKAIDGNIRDGRAAVALVEHCRSVHEERREELKTAEQELTRLEKDLEVSKKESSLATDAAEAAIRRVSISSQELRELWLGWPAAQDEYLVSAGQFLERFREGTRSCFQIGSKLENLGQRLLASNMELDGLLEQFKVAERAKNARMRELQEAINCRKGLLEQRGKLLDGRTVVVVEAELEKELKQTDRALQEAQTTLREADKQLALVCQQVEAQHATIEANKKELHESTTCLTNWLEGFCETQACELTVEDLDRYLSRAQTWLEAERESLDKLAAEVRTTLGAYQAYGKNLSSHQQTRPTTDVIDVVLQEIETLQKTIVEARDANERTRAALIHDDDVRRKNASKLLELAQAEEQAAPWQKLNELIGSADGAKFRKIAQRHTLDLLLRYSNQQLRQLAPRYQLERLPESLNLIVVDCDMGDERRSIHSLSGGEIFLVSLALALGLASLTTDRVRVESLFIDEGFGSLDTHSLNIAMTALMQLESQGRKVGVISHVQEMTEAIPVQIKVEKGPNGASRLVVPGTETGKYDVDSFAGYANAAVATC